MQGLVSPVDCCRGSIGDCGCDASAEVAVTCFCPDPAAMTFVSPVKRPTSVIMDPINAMGIPTVTKDKPSPISKRIAPTTIGPASNGLSSA